MCNDQKKTSRSSRPLFSMALLFFCINAYTQNRLVNDSISKISTDHLFRNADRISFFPKDSLYKSSSSLISAKNSKSNKNIVFFDSLKSRASKNTISKQLYDLIIVSRKAIENPKITGTSDASYIEYSGMKIRTIELQRLDVFGVNIKNPGLANPKKIETLLNKTHVNTSEIIIRKNLLISAGDTISPLTLSDNERILRQLPFIDDARIMILPFSDDEVDIVVLTKDVYSLGGTYSFNGLKEGTVSVFEKNILGMGQELGLEIPYDTKLPDSPGFGAHYLINNIRKSFINLKVSYLEGLGDKTYGFSLNRKLVSSTTKYSGGISVFQMYTNEDFNEQKAPEPLKYNLQDYWLTRSFLLSKESVSRIIIGARYTNNNVFERPLILPNSYYYLERYKLFIGSAALSIQKYYKTNNIYGYGRTEDIPYGGLYKLTFGKELNEKKERIYMASEISVGKSSEALGYFYASAGISTFLNKTNTEQGLLSLKMKYFSNLLMVKNNTIRNFVSIDYTRGFDRYTDEFLIFNNENGFSGFKNDSISGTQRISLSLESVLFSSINFYDFRFAFFGFTDFAFLCGSNEFFRQGNALSGIGLGVRIRNNNLIFNTFQFRFGFFPNLPAYSQINHLIVSGEQLLAPNNFNPGPPSVMSYR
jgi:hypothetical protein